MLLSRRLAQGGIEFEMQIQEIITSWLRGDNSAQIASVGVPGIIRRKQDLLLINNKFSRVSVCPF